MGIFRDMFYGPVVWTADEGLAFSRLLWKALLPKYHCALTGSVLYAGESRKDLDIIVYPHSTTVYDDSEVCAILKKFGMEVLSIQADHYGPGVRFWSYKGRRIDVISAPTMIIGKTVTAW